MNSIGMTKVLVKLAERRMLHSPSSAITAVLLLVLRKRGYEYDYFSKKVVRKELLARDINISQVD
jgi:hypothetical protein